MGITFHYRQQSIKAITTVKCLGKGQHCSTKINYKSNYVNIFPFTLTLNMVQLHLILPVSQVSNALAVCDSCTLGVGSTRSVHRLELFHRQRHIGHVTG